MEYQATSKYIRTSTRKMRLVADSIRKMTPDEAVITLGSMPKRAAEPMLKTLNSVIANAKNQNAKLEGLKFKTIEIMGGPVLKRWHAVSRGMAHAFKKRMTHVRIIITDEKVKEKQHGA
jgi:large subunit ribosomal protein L22